jgi:phosphate uptake regulator
MESRKIIRFGKSSYVVSLPQDWLKNNSLDKGDLIYFNQQENDLILVPKIVNKKKELKSIELNISKLEIRDIERRIISAYIQNYNVIRIYGKDFHLKSKEIKNCIQNIMALEIMEETSEKIIAKDFLKMNEISPYDLIKRMDVITRSMFLDTIKVNEENLLESIYDRDYDVNRLSFLLCRSIQYLLSNLSEASNKGYNPKILLKYNNVGKFIERTADSIKRSSKLKTRINFKKDQEIKINIYLKELYSYYENALKSFYKNDVDKALIYANLKNIYIKESKILYEENWETKNYALLIEKLKDLIDSIHNILRELYN